MYWDDALTNQTTRPGERLRFEAGGSQRSSDERKVLRELKGSKKASWRNWHLIKGLKDRKDSDDVQVKGIV